MKIFTSLALLQVILISSYFTTMLLYRPEHRVLGRTTDLSASAILALINTIRVQSNIPTLTPADTLMEIAQAKADHMAAHQYFAHEFNGINQAWIWLESSGYAYTQAAENLARGYLDAVEAVEGWMASDSHAANILDPVFSHTGVGVNQSNPQRPIVVQLFATTRYEPTVASDYNESGTLEAKQTFSTLFGIATLASIIWLIVYYLLVHTKFDIRLWKRSQFPRKALWHS